MLKRMKNTENTRSFTGRIRRILALFCALSLLCSSAVATSPEAMRTEEEIISDPITPPIPLPSLLPSITPDAVITPAPEGTDAPVTPEDPDATVDPEATADPENSEEPGAPEETTDPENPAETDLPEETELPEETAPVFEAGYLSASGEGWEAILRYPAEAEIPADAVLTLTEIHGTALYSLMKTAASLLRNDRNSPWTRKLSDGDSHFYTAAVTDAAGNRIEPKAEVTLRYTNLHPNANQAYFSMNEGARILSDENGVIRISAYTGETFGYGTVEQVQVGTVTLQYSNPDYIVTASYGPEAEFPAGTKLNVREIRPGTPEYAICSGLTGDALNEDWNEITLERYFDITFISDGVELEPQAPVDVQVLFRDKIELTEENDVQAVHIANNEATVIESETDSNLSARRDSEAIDTVTFASDSFSVYGVVQRTKITSKVLASDGNTYEISVTYGQDADIPEGAQVIVEEIPEGSERWEAYRRQTAVALGADDVRLPGLYDISIRTDGGKIEPKAPVSVSIRLMNAEENEELQVVHFTEELPEELLAPQEDQQPGATLSEGQQIASEPVEITVEGDTVSFTTEGFSVYAFAYTVEFTYEGKSCTMLGNEERMLSTLLASLEIAIPVENITNVSSESSFIKIIPFDGDWLIKILPSGDETSSLIIETEKRVITVEMVSTGIEQLVLEESGTSIRAASEVYLPSDAEGYSQVIAPEAAQDTIQAVEAYANAQTVQEEPEAAGTEETGTEETGTEAEDAGEGQTPAPETDQGEAETENPEASNVDGNPEDSGNAAETTEETEVAEPAFIIRTGTEVNYQIYDIGLTNVNLEDYPEGFNVRVALQAEVNTESVSLYHLHDGVVSEITNFSLENNELIFQTNDFSEFVLRYTVDFTYTDELGNTYAWSFPGRGSYPLTDILAEMKIEGIPTAAELTLVEGEDQEGALYLIKEGEDWFLNSDIAFTDTYQLKITVDDKVYVLRVTDAIINHTININLGSELVLPAHVYFAVKFNVHIKENEYYEHDENRYYFKELTNKTSGLQTYKFIKIYDSEGKEQNLDKVTQINSIEAYLAEYKHSSAGEIKTYNDLIYNANEYHNSSKINNQDVVISIIGNAITISIGATDQRTYSASIQFYDAWSDTPRSDLNLTDYSLVGTDEEGHTYTANVTNSGNLTFVDGSEQSVDELPEIVSWNFYKDGAETTEIEGGYVLSEAALSGNTYTFEARVPNTYSARITFRDANGSTVENPIVKDENDSYCYSILATTDVGDATYTATVTGNGELTWEPDDTNTLPKVTEFVFRDASDGTVSQTSRFGDYELSVVSYEDADLAQNDPQGQYQIIAKVPLLRNVAFRFKNQDGNELDGGSPLTLEECHYYIVATVGSAQDSPQYYAEITGSANAVTNVSFTDGAGNSVTQLGENTTFELRKSANACNSLSDVMNNASVTSRFLTNDNGIYVMEDAAVSGDGTTYTLSAREYVPSPQVDTVIVRLTDVAGNVIRPSTLPSEKLYVLAKLTTKGDSSDMKGWCILKIDNNAFNNEPVGEWSGMLNNQNFYFKGDGDNWVKSNNQGYSSNDYDLVLRLYKSNNDINVDEASAYNNLTAQGTDGAPEGYAFVGIFNHDGLGGARTDATLPEKTALIRLRESAGAVYGMRAYVGAPGLTLTEADKYIVRVKIDHETTGSSYAFGKLVVNPEAGPEAPVELQLLSGKTQNDRSSVWHDASASQWVDTVTLNETNVTIQLLHADGNIDAETLMKSSTEGHYEILKENADSIKTYTWASGERQRETDEDGVEHVYDVIHLNLAEGDISVGEIQNALRNATNFGLYTENLLKQGTDMEANIAAAYVTGPVSDGYGFSNNNVFINSINVTKHWTGTDGSGKQGENVTLKLYPIEGYDEHSGTYVGLGTPTEKTGVTDADGRFEITFDQLAPGYYLLKEVQTDGIEVSFEDGTNGVVTLGDNKSVTFSDGLLKITNINVNINYFSDVSALTDDQVRALLRNSRQGWVVTDNQTTYDRLVQQNNMLNEAERSKVSMAGTADFPVIYNIPSDMAALRTLSGRLAKEMSSKTVKVINTTAKAINDAGGMHITSDGLFVVMNITVENASDVNPIKVETQVDGITLDAEFGKTGSEYASKVLYNFINPDGTPFSGEITTVAVGSGILFAPAGTVGSLGGNWGGTIVCRNADHTGSEIHSDNANKTIKINTMLSNAEAEHDVGDLRLEKQAIGDIMPDNTTWFTFKIVLMDAQGNPVNGIFNTSAQRNNVNTVTFTDGEATVDVRANNIVIIKDIPVGYTYTLDELETASTSHYQKAWIENKDGEHVNSGTIEKSETAIARIVNVRKVGGLSVTKTVVGDPSGAKKFEFRVTILNDDSTTNTEFNGSYGNMVFTDGVAAFELGNGEFRTAKDIPTGTKFKVEEVLHDENCFETVSKVYVMDPNQTDLFKVDDTDDSITGEIIEYNNEKVAIIANFTNTHTNDATYMPKVSKVLRQIGDNTIPVKWPAEGFTFRLVDSSGNELGTATATKDSPIASFNAITYQSEGTFTYTITEVVPQDAANSRKDGVIYNQTPLTVTVVVEKDDVTDPQNPTFSISSVKYGDDPEVTTDIGIQRASGTITNDYDSVMAMPKAVKMLNGAEFTGTLSDGTAASFTFDLKEVNNGTVGNILQTVTTGDDGTMTFHGIDYIEPGEHTYQIIERLGEDTEAMIYDSTPVYWKVSVTADGENNRLAVSDEYYSDIACQNRLTKAVFKNIEKGKIVITKTFTFEEQDLTEDADTSGVYFTIQEKGTDPAVYITHADNSEKWYYSEFSTGIPRTLTLTQDNGIRVGKTYVITEYGANGVTVAKNILQAKTTVKVDDGAANESDHAEATATAVGPVISFTNTYSRTFGEVRVTKTFSGITDAQIPSGFQIEAVWGPEGSQQSRTLKINGMDSYEDVVMTGDGLAYTWTIKNLPIGTEVTFTESGHQINGYYWTGTVSVNGGTASNEVTGTATVVSDTTNRVDFVNSYNVGVELPATGGPGTLVYTLSGLALVLLAGVLLISRKRRKA